MSRFRVLVLAVLGGSISTPAIAQSAADAFECKLRYRATLEAVAALSVAKQTEVPRSFAFGPETTVEFAPGATRVVGQAPSALSLKMSEPLNMAREPVHVVLTAEFPRTPDIEQALTAAFSAISSCPASLNSCVRLAPVAGDGTWEYSRHDPAVLRVTCHFAIREADLQG